MPNSAEELESVAAAADLEEGPRIDGKLRLDSEGWKLATDVAAMSTDGGVIIVGLGEDEHKRLTKLNPMLLAGLEERIAAIVSTGVAEAPYIEIRPLDRGDGAGYVVIHVPMSARAPHQVIASGKNQGRYYGRYGTTNRILNEGEIARLYERRQRWQLDVEHELTLIRDHPRVALPKGIGRFHALVYPVMPHQQMWSRAERQAGGRSHLLDALAAAARSVGKPTFPANLSYNVQWHREGGDVWSLDSDRGVQPYHGVRVDINMDGRSTLLMAGAANREGDGNQLVLWEDAIAGNFAAFLAIMDRFYELACYAGAVEVALIVTGIEGAITSLSLNPRMRGFTLYSAPTFTRYERLSASAALNDSKNVSRRMLHNLVAASTGDDDYDPFPAGD